jgi:general stress protein 26
MKKTTAEHDPKAADRLRKLIEEISVAMLTTVTPDGTLRSRPMVTSELRDPGELWLFTSDDSGKAHDLAEERGINVSYADPERDRYVSVSGQAAIVHDNDRLHELWDASMTRFFPKGLDDPHLALLRVRIEWAEYWDAATRQMKRIDDAGVDASDKGSDDGETDSGNKKETRHVKVDIRATPESG